MLIFVHSNCVTYIPTRMFLFSLFIFSLFLVSQSAGTKFSRSKTIILENQSAPNLTTVCTEGFALLNGVCVVDECHPENEFCPDGTFCINRNGSYVCEECPRGTRVEPGSRICTCDEEQCSKYNGRSCQPGSVGLNECLCRPEFVEDLNGEKCNPRCPFGSSLNFTALHVHTNFTSSPKVDCVCPDTHEKYGSFCLKRCKDRGDCNGGECEYHENHKVCACPRGFELDFVKKQCIDIDECRIKRPGYMCANFPGGYGCTGLECDQGFTPLTGLGLCLKKGIGITHFMRKSAIKLLMSDIKENNAFITTKLPKAYKLELSEVRINPEEFAEYIRVSIQSKGDESQELIMESIKPFPREEKVYIDVIAWISEEAFIYELRTNLYVSRYPFTIDIIGHD